MTTKKGTKKPESKSTNKPARTIDADDLAALVSAVMLHPDLPTTLHNYFGEGLIELFNDLSAPQKKTVEFTPARVGDLLRLTAENEKGGE